MTTSHRLAVIGAGTMGTGITTLATSYGIPVVLLDVSAQALESAEAAVRGQRRLAQMMGSLPADEVPGELRVTTSVDGIGDSTAVIETVIERAEVKEKVLSEASAAAPEAVLISNTSAIPIGEQASALAQPERLVGVHFMNPPYLIRAVEVIRGPQTGDQALADARGLLDALGLRQVLVGDGPGFVINRILQRSINEAARIVADGVATPQAVDDAFRECLGHPSGPLATADLIGIDNVVDTLRVLYARTQDAGYVPCDLLLEKVSANHLGRKTGQGFFEYPGAQR